MTDKRQVHPASAAVVATLAEDVAGLLYWLGRDLDASVEPDDVVQELALAQLEAQAATSGQTGEPLRQTVQRRVRREVWQVRWTRGRAHRADWDDARAEYTAGSDAGLATTEELGWNDVVRILGWEDGLAFWLSAIEEWSLGEIGEWQALTKQQVWHRIQHAREQLRRRLGVPTGS